MFSPCWQSDEFGEIRKYFIIYPVCCVTFSFLLIWSSKNHTQTTFYRLKNRLTPWLKCQLRNWIWLRPWNKSNFMNGKNTQTICHWPAPITYPVCTHWAAPMNGMLSKIHHCAVSCYSGKRRAGTNCVHSWGNEDMRHEQERNFVFKKIAWSQYIRSWRMRASHELKFFKP